MDGGKRFLLPLLLVVAVVAVIGLGLFLNRGDEQSPQEVSFYEYPTALPAPEDPDMMFVMEEYALEKYDFCPDCYPQFAEKYPDSPCATWENDGLRWKAPAQTATLL